MTRTSLDPSGAPGATAGLTGSAGTRLNKPSVAPQGVPTPDQVTPEQLAKYAALIYKRTGIRVAPQKSMLLSNRVRRRLRETGIPDYDAYLAHLQKLSSVDPEWDNFLQEITTHETYLFRDEAQWQWFRQTYLPQVAKEARAGARPKSLRIWSAAASTGDEPMTVACCLAEAAVDLPRWQLKILGTDIGVGALEQARAANFGERAMKLVPDKLKKQFFIKSADGHHWQARPALREMVEYRQHNLLDSLQAEPFDLVLLKNVLIYFDQQSKQTVLGHVTARIVPGGLLVAGAAEGVSDLLRDLERVEPWLFRQPAPRGGRT